MKERKFYFMRTFVTNKKQNRKRGREKREEGRTNSVCNFLLKQKLPFARKLQGKRRKYLGRNRKEQTFCGSR